MPFAFSCDTGHSLCVMIHSSFSPLSHFQQTNVIGSPNMCWDCDELTLSTLASHNYSMGNKKVVDPDGMSF